jgi:glycosyltransferase involved in cell wall biosynthesis
MRVLVVSGAYPPHRSGEATNAFYLAQRLADRGVDVDVLTSQGAVAHAHPRITLHPVMRTWSWGEMPRLGRVLTRCRPDAVLLVYIGWIYRYQFMVTFLPTLVRKVLPGVPVVTRFENAMGADPRHTGLAARGLRRLMAAAVGPGDVDYCYGTLLRDSHGIIVLSERHRAILSEVFQGSRGKSVLIPPAANMCVSTAPREVGRRRLGVEDDTFVITYIGYLHEGKGLESLLQAFAAVRTRRPRARLVMMGGAIDPTSGNAASYVETLHALAGSLGIASHVTWTGAYSSDSEDTSVLLRAADVCVLPFRQGVHLNNSSFASVAAHAIPVITTQGDFFEEQFVHDENVYVCPPDSPAALEAAIEKVMTDPALRARLRAGIARLADEWFSWDRLVDRTLATCGLVAGDGDTEKDPRDDREIARQTSGGGGC